MSERLDCVAEERERVREVVLFILWRFRIKRLVIVAPSGCLSLLHTSLLVLGLAN